MTASLGGFDLGRIQSFRWWDRTVTLTGILMSKNKWNTLREMFMDASEGTVVGKAGIEKIGEDLDPDHRYTQFLVSDKEEVRSGFYLLVGFNYVPRLAVTEFNPYSIDLWYLGSKAEYYHGVFAKDLEDLTNDWSL